MSRSTKKGPYIDERLLGKITKMNQAAEKKVIRTWARASVITPDFVGHTLAIHNGKTLRKMLNQIFCNKLDALL